MSTTAALATPVPTPTATVTQVVVEQPVAGAEGIKNVVASRSDAFGDIVDTLDKLAVQVGHTRVSLWDLMVVFVVIALVITIAWASSRLTSRLLARARHLDLTQRLLIEKMAGLLIWAIAILVGIDVLGIDLTALTVFSGAFGLAVGFGLQKTFGNLIAGLILLMDRSIKPGDVIAVNSGKDVAVGQVKKIGIRAVSITTRDQIEYLIPNENLMTSQVENWSYSSRDVRVKVPVSVAYGTDIDRAEALMLQAARAVSRVHNDPAPSAWLKAFGDNAIEFEIQCWIDDPEEGVGNVRSDVLKQVWHLFRENGVEIPFPQRVLHMAGPIRVEREEG